VAFSYFPLSFPLSILNCTLQRIIIKIYLFILTLICIQSINPLMELLTTKEVAEKLGVTLRRVQAMIETGRLPATKFGRDYMIKETDLKLVENRKVGRPKKAKA